MVACRSGCQPSSPAICQSSRAVGCEPSGVFTAHSIRTNGQTVSGHENSGVAIVTRVPVAVMTSPSAVSMPATSPPSTSKFLHDFRGASPTACTPHSSPAMEKCQPAPPPCCQVGNGQPSAWARPRCCCIDAYPASSIRLSRKACRYRSRNEGPVQSDDRGSQASQSVQGMNAPGRCKACMSSSNRIARSWPGTENRTGTSSFTTHFQAASSGTSPGEPAATASAARAACAPGAGAAMMATSTSRAIDEGFKGASHEASDRHPDCGSDGSGVHW